MMRRPLDERISALSLAVAEAGEREILRRGRPTGTSIWMRCGWLRRWRAGRVTTGTC